MAYSLDLNKLMNDIRGPKGVAAITDELGKIRSEFNRVSGRVQPEAERKLRDLQKNILVVRKNFESKIKKIEKDIQSTLTLVKKSAVQAESKLQAVMGRTGKAKKKSAKKTSKNASAKTAGKRVRTSQKKARA